MKKDKRARIAARKQTRTGGCSANKGLAHFYKAGEMTCVGCGAYSAERAKMYAETIVLDDSPNEETENVEADTQLA